MPARCGQRRRLNMRLCSSPRPESDGFLEKLRLRPLMRELASRLAQGAAPRKCIADHSRNGIEPVSEDVIG